MTNAKRAALLIWATALISIGCGAKKINHVLADPSRYSNRQVEVRGEVVESYSIARRGAYRIKDDTGELWVVSTRGVPREGARVKVKGTIREGFNLGSIIQLPRQLSSGLVLVESSHKASP